MVHELNSIGIYTNKLKDKTFLTKRKLKVICDALDKDKNIVDNAVHSLLSTILNVDIPSMQKFYICVSGRHFEETLLKRVPKEYVVNYFKIPHRVEEYNGVEADEYIPRAAY